MSEPNVHANRESPAPADASRNGPLSLSERVKSLRLPDRAPPKRSPFVLVPWVLFLVFFVATIVLAMRTPTAQTSEMDDVARRERDKSLTLAGAPAAQAEVMLESKGYIVPIHKTQVSPKVSGMVEVLSFEEGMLVQKGDVLAVLEKLEYEADRDHTKAQVLTARNRWEELALSLEFQIRQAEADLADAKAQHQNEFVQLQSEINAKQATPVVDVLKRKATVDAKLARVDWQTNQLNMINKGSLARKVGAAKGDLDLFEADLVKAEWRLANCVVRAPVTGIILTKQAEVGSLVNPSAFSNGLSASLCDMADLTELEVDLAIPERDVSRVIEFRREHKDKPQKCVVKADAFPNRPYNAYVSRIMPTADQSKAAVPVRVRIIVPASEAGVFLRPQMNAAVTFLNAESDAAVIKPFAGAENKGK